MADTPANEVEFAALGAYQTAERTLAQELLASLSGGMLCLADRGFYSFEMFTKARKTGAALLWRVRADVGLPREQTLCDGSYLTTIYALEDRKARRDGQPARVIEYRLDDPALTESEQRYRLIEALGEALAAGTYIHWLRQAVRSAPHLVAEQREVLDEALRFAERFQWNVAVRLLLNGFEGAVFSALVATDGYADPGSSRVHATEKLMDSEVFEPEFRQFVKRRLYTDRGNPFRHGRTAPGARELTLMGIVALAGGLEQFALDRRARTSRRPH